MTRNPAGEWCVDVSRDLEGVLDAWKSRSDSPGTVAVLHVGFDRPPSSHFDAVATEFSGKVLVTAAARFALPSGFVSSSRPVADVGGLPIYVGLRGWGYLLEEPVIDTPDPLLGVALSAPAEGWVRDYIEANADAAAAIGDATITDEISYLSNEHRLEPALRRSLGHYRYRRLVVGKEDDPCGIAQAAPPWLQEREFATMSLSVRAANALANENIRVVSDLANYTTRQLLQIANFGRTSVKDVVRRLEDALEQGPFSVSEKMIGAGDGTLLAGIRRSLLNYTDREQAIIRRRMGLDNTAETLQQIAQDYGITRERIRQIEAKVVNRLRREEFWDDLLSAKLVTLLHERNIPLPLLGVEAADGWFSGMAEHPDAMEYVLTNICDGKAAIVTVDGIAYLAFLTQDGWNSALKEARRLLESGVGREWSRDYCRTVVYGLLPETAREFRSLLWDHGSSLCHFAGDGANQELVAYGRGAEQVVEAVLNDAASPLHFTEIARLASARAGREIDVRRAHNAAAAIGILFARGTYGLDHHLSISREDMAALALEAEEIVNDGPAERQWHTFEIRAALLERGSELIASIDKFVLDNALLRSRSLERLGRMTWAAKRSSGDSEANRIDLRQAVIVLLQQAGRPLKTQDIRQRLIATRGVNSLFQIVAGDPLIRVGWGLWGLNDRDLPIKRQDQAALLDGIVEILRERESGIHSTELAGLQEVAGGLSASVIFSLASGDSRLRVNQAQYLYLAGWEGPRRESVTEAVEKVLSQATGPLEFDEIVRAVVVRVRRDCERTAISSCLQGLDAVHDPISGLWSIASTEAEDPFEEAA